MPRTSTVLSLLAFLGNRCRSSTLFDSLRIIVKAGFFLRGSVEALAGIVGGLLIVRVLYFLWHAIGVIRLVIGVVGFIDVDLIDKIG